MHLRKVILSLVLFSFVFLSILNAAQDTAKDTAQNKAQDKASDTSSSSVPAKTGAKASVPAGPQNEATSSAAASPIPQSEVDSIVQQFESTFVSATNRGDAKTLLELYTSGATILNEVGRLAVGRETIQHVLSAAFALSGRPTIQETTRKSIAVSSTVIVTHGVLRVTPLPPDPTPPQDTFYTKILTLDGGQWRIAAIQYAQPNPWNVTFPPTAVGETSSKTVNLRNIGPTELTIRGWSIKGKYAENFMETNNCAAPIPPSGGCAITFTFRPLAPGSPRSYLSFWDDAGTGRHLIRLVGAGQ